MGASILNTLLGLFTAGAWGTKSGYGIGATIFAWFVLIAVFTSPLWLIAVIGVFGAIVDTVWQTLKSLSRLVWTDTAMDKNGNVVNSSVREGVLAETAKHHPDSYEEHPHP
ncbi:hypothetical protein HY312_01060 [Candidatus Saccharibacteria bacterium]|nr:hypothetical protein [Candidatus Saccharibacteria bacterium]